jgi:flavodoxin
MAIAQADGSIILTTQVDTSGVNNGLSSIQGAAKKAGAAIAAAFAAKQIIQFSKAAGELATKTEASVLRLVDIYGQASEKVGDFIDANARGLGMSKAAAASYASVYGNTKKAVRYLAECLEAEGCPKVILADLCRAEMSEVIEAAFRYPITVFASVTYNGTMFPPMRELLANLKERNFSNRSVAIIENGAWTSAAGRAMLRVLEDCKSIRYSSPVLTLSGALTRENKESLSLLAKKLKEELS